MTAGKILLLEDIHTGAKANFEGAGFEVELLKTSLPDEELIEALDGVLAVGIRSKTHLTPRIIEAAPSLRAIGAFCIGTNQIALDAARQRSIPAFNAPFSNTRSVAELVMAEIVFLARRLGDRNSQMHAGAWRKSSSGCREVRGKTLGIVGYGHIGRQVGVLAEAFGMDVSFFDIASRLPMGNNTPGSTLDALLAKSDFLTLHVPATPQTENMIGAKQLARMKKGSHLLNLSRGNVVVIEDLAAAIDSGHLAGAAIDVFPAEPRQKQAEFNSPLRGLNNVLLTPHIGGSTVEAQVSIGQEVSNALIKYLQSGATVGSVNFPQAELARRDGAVRIQHIHENVPGVLGDVHRIAAQCGANVLSQVLVTDGDLGYLLMDVARVGGENLCDQVGGLSTTRRVRLLS